MYQEGRSYEMYKAEATCLNCDAPTFEKRNTPVSVLRVRGRVFKAATPRAIFDSRHALPQHLRDVWMLIGKTVRQNND